MSHTTEAPVKIAHHFDSLEQQNQAASLGMWVFVAQEVMFFGGLFLAYLVYRFSYPLVFAEASQYLDVLYGGINTGILITSSLTMALAVHGAQTGRRKALVGHLVLTLILGAAFLGVKAIEYHHKFEVGLFPGGTFHYTGALPNIARLFFGLYFAMTGMHALHMIIGIGILLWLIPLAAKGRFTPEQHAPIENFGLYWHFVDIVWIFLFPLLYLIGHHHP